MEPTNITIKVVIQNWTGWSEEQLKPQEFRLDVKAGDTIDSHQLGDQVLLSPIRILEADPEKVKIQTSGLVLEGRGGGISLDSNTTDLETVIAKGRKARLTTPTMDAGTACSVYYL